MRLRAVALSLLVAAWPAFSSAHAQQTPVNPSPLPKDSVPPPIRLRVFLDCNFCDFDFMRTEINFVDYVRDRQDAGRMAGRALVSAGGDFTPHGMSSYPREWRRHTGLDLRISYAVNRRISGYRDADWDRAIRRLDRLSAKQAARVFASDFSVSWALGVLLTDPSLVTALARHLMRRA